MSIVEVFNELSPNKNDVGSVRQVWFHVSLIVC